MNALQALSDTKLFFRYIQAVHHGGLVRSTPRGLLKMQSKLSNSVKLAAPTPKSTDKIGQAFAKCTQEVTTAMQAHYSELQTVAKSTIQGRQFSDQSFNMAWDGALKWARRSLGRKLSHNTLDTARAHCHSAAFLRPAATILAPDRAQTLSSSQPPVSNSNSTNEEWTTVTASRDRKIRPITAVSGPTDPLSNFFSFRFSHRGVSHGSVEHAYQMEKAQFLGNFRAWHEILAAPNAQVAKRTSDRWFKSKEFRGLCQGNGWMKRRLADWDSRKADVVLQLLREKSGQCRLFSQTLCNTGTNRLCHNVTDKYWGTGSSDPNVRGTGKNVFGQLLEKIRNELMSKPGPYCTEREMRKQANQPVTSYRDVLLGQQPSHSKAEKPLGQRHSPSKVNKPNDELLGQQPSHSKAEKPLGQRLSPSKVFKLNDELLGQQPSTSKTEKPLRQRHSPPKVITKCKTTGALAKTIDCQAEKATKERINPVSPPKTTGALVSEDDHSKTSLEKSQTANTVENELGLLSHNRPTLFSDSQKLDPKPQRIAGPRETRKRGRLSTSPQTPAKRPCGDKQGEGPLSVETPVTRPKGSPEDRHTRVLSMTSPIVSPAKPTLGNGSLSPLRSSLPELSDNLSASLPIFPSVASLPPAPSSSQPCAKSTINNFFEPKTKKIKFSALKSPSTGEIFVLPDKTRLLKTIAKSKWRLPKVNKPILIVGDSLLSSISSIRQSAAHLTQILSYPGARYLHLYEIFKNLQVPHTHVKHLILCIGVNNRGQNTERTTANKDIRSLIYQAKTKFPNAKIYYASLKNQSFTPNEAHNLIEQEKTWRKHSSITILPGIKDVVTMDGIHWVASTAKRICDNWLDHIDLKN